MSTPTATERLLQRLVDDKLKALRQRETAIYALALCSEKFEIYAKHHMAKGDQEKADSNRQMGEMCESAIHAATGGDE